MNIEQLRATLDRTDPQYRLTVQTQNGGIGGHRTVEAALATTRWTR